MAPLRVLVADDSALLRKGVVRLLQDAGMDVVGEAGDTEELLRKVQAHAPDVAIVDVQMPPDRTDDGLRAALAIRATRPGTAVLVLSQFLEERYALDLIGDDARGVGYLLKDRVADVGSLVEAIERVAAGGSALDPEVVARMVGRRRAEDPLAGLTPREREVLALMAEGKSNRGIADLLGVSPAAVDKHAARLFDKLGLGAEPSEHRRVMAVLTLLRAS
ncbi:response regulator transcription factor [Conexibacter woesei]|uniref:Two component transcriptional regulator, LuxR family n=1 Tax=Conexibacter woesei (strain DSM 14684 / CCUG 47730 / CIP 108061 / JCM 11494 / NBRC 100937 / ID131577) TaxID=469383 RepID=D3F683_CONWI|nr:response regulator transcription factor [Conexibacter woesei]ADB48756.1 two component transcriptional regulator, LuxR family [Conexibacter woesei DSM 14684]